MAQGFLLWNIYVADQQIIYRLEVDFCGHEIVIRNFEIVAFVGNCVVSPSGDRLQN